MSVERTNPAFVTGMSTDLKLTWNMVRTQQFYGPKIPTRTRIHYLSRWRRVYVMQYANSGSAYIIVRGRDVFLDIDTEYALAEGLPSERLVNL